jgi:ATP-dependent Lon protease
VATDEPFIRHRSHGSNTALDEDHYGLEDVKDRMLEFLAAGKSCGAEDLHHTRTALDEDHYGLEDVKDRMLKFLVAGKSRGTEDLHQEIYRDSKGAE